MRLPPPNTTRYPTVQVAPQLTAPRVIELRDDHRVPVPAVARVAVHRVRRDPPERLPIEDAQLARALAVVGEVGDSAAVGRDARHRFRPQQAVEHAGARCWRARRRARRGCLRPQARERASRRHALDLTTDPERDELRRRGLDESRHRRVADRRGEVLQEPTAVGIGREAVGPTREGLRVPRRAGSTGRAVCREQLGVEAAPHAPAVREARLVVRRESLDQPRRLVFVREQPRGPSQHVLRDGPEAPRAVEVEDVSQLVRRDEPQPGVVLEQPGIGRGRRGQDRDATGGKHRSESVGAIDVVAQREVHRAAWWMQLGGEQRVRPLRLARLGERDVAVRGTEVDAEVRRVEGAPGAGGIDLSLGSPGEQRERNKEAERQDAERSHRRAN